MRRYFPLLAKALDYNELEEYRFFVSVNQDPKKKFQWSSPDKAGTEPLGRPVRQDQMPLAGFLAERGHFKGASNLDIRLAKARNAALSQNRQVIYIHPDRTLRDEIAGNVLGKYSEIGKFLDKGYIPFSVHPSQIN